MCLILNKLLHQGFWSTTNQSYMVVKDLPLTKKIKMILEIFISFIIYDKWWIYMITCVLNLFKSKFYDTLKVPYLEGFLDLYPLPFISISVSGTLKGTTNQILRIIRLRSFLFSMRVYLRAHSFSMCAYQGVKNNSFLEIFAYVIIQ